jgi:hypothetical protein
MFVFRYILRYVGISLRIHFSQPATAKKNKQLETDVVILTCSCNALLISSSPFNLSLREV